MNRNLIFTDIDILPAFVIGYSGVHEFGEQAPPWLSVVQHQYGGYACCHETLSGCVLRLAANQDQGTGKLWLLTRALVELGESWPPDHVCSAREARALLEQIAELASVACAAGLARPMTAEENRRLGDLLIEHLAFPGLRPPRSSGGREALISFEGSSALPFFDNWRIAQACACSDGQFAWREHTRYDREIHDWLTVHIGRGTPPGLALLWENCD